VRSRIILTSRTQSALLNNIGFITYSAFGVPANLMIAWRLFKRRKMADADATIEPFGPLSLVKSSKARSSTSFLPHSHVELETKSSPPSVADTSDCKSFAQSVEDLEGLHSTNRYQRRAPRFTASVHSRFEDLDVALEPWDG
jgi:hypothetical protein